MTTEVTSIEQRVATSVAGLRERGLDVSTTQALALVEGLAATGGTHVAEVALATLACSPAEAARVAETFGPRPLGATTIGVELDGSAGAGGDERRDAPARAASSPAEVLRRRDLAACTAAEREDIARRLRRVPLVGPPRRSRRRRPARRAGRVDGRATARAAVRRSGHLIEVRTDRRCPGSRRVVVLLDVSGSMEPYARTLLHWAHVAVRAGHGVEVFALGTRLTRLTRALAAADPDVACRTAVALAPDWGSGTRLGATVGALHADPAAAGAARGAVVVVVSDGLDRGDTDELRAQMARLARLAHRVVWVNPLRAGDGYEPRARGMAAALPYVDLFLDGHSLAAYEDLAARLARPIPRGAGRVGAPRR